MRELYASILGLSEILAVNVSTSHEAQLSSATVECINSSIDVGDDISIDLGYTDEHSVVFTGIVKSVDDEETSNGIKKTVVASDVLSRASDYFIVSSSPDSPYTTSNIAPETLIGDLLAMAGITNYTGDTSGYTWGVAGPIEVQLVSSYDYCKTLADMIAWGFWAREDGSVRFAERKPFPMISDVSVGTVADTQLLSCNSWRSDKGLRNRVVVWGSTGVYAESSASSPYLPDGFYKTAVVSAPGIIDDQAMAQAACDYNLAIYNRLTQGYSVSTLGNPAYLAKRILHLDYTGEDLYIFSSEQTWGKAGYLCHMELRKE